MGLFPDKRYQEIIDLLHSSKDIDVDAMDNRGRTPLSWAAGTAAADTLLCSDNLRTPVVKQLLKTGRADVNSRDNNGQTPLDWAAAAGYRGKVVVRLLKREKGANGWFEVIRRGTGSSQ